MLLLLPKRQEDDLIYFRAETFLPRLPELVFFWSTWTSVVLGSVTTRHDAARANFRGVGDADDVWSTVVFESVRTFVEILRLHGAGELVTDRLDFTLNRLFFLRVAVTMPGGGDRLSCMNGRLESSIDESDRSLQSTAMDLGTESFGEYGDILTSLPDTLFLEIFTLSFSLLRFICFSSAAFMIFLYLLAEIAAFGIFPPVSETSETYFSKSFIAIIITFFLADGGVLHSVVVVSDATRVDDGQSLELLFDECGEHCSLGLSKGSFGSAITERVGDVPRRGHFGAESSLLLVDCDKLMERGIDCNGISLLVANTKALSERTDDSSSSLFRDICVTLIFITSLLEDSSSTSMFGTSMMFDNLTTASRSFCCPVAVSSSDCDVSSSSHRRTGLRGEWSDLDFPCSSPKQLCIPPPVTTTMEFVPFGWEVVLCFDV